MEKSATITQEQLEEITREIETYALIYDEHYIKGYCENPNFIFALIAFYKHFSNQSFKANKEKIFALLQNDFISRTLSNWEMKPLQLLKAYYSKNKFDLMELRKYKNIEQDLKNHYSKDKS